MRGRHPETRHCNWIEDMKKLYQEIPNLYLFINQEQKKAQEAKSKKQLHILTTIIHFSVLAEARASVSLRIFLH